MHAAIFTAWCSGQISVNCKHECALVVEDGGGERKAQWELVSMGLANVGLSRSEPCDNCVYIVFSAPHPHLSINHNLIFKCLLIFLLLFVRIYIYIHIHLSLTSSLKIGRQSGC